MKREHWCAHRGCGCFAVPGFDYCDPHLEEIEEQQAAKITVTDLGRTEPPKPKLRKAGYKRSDYRSDKLTPEQKLDNIAQRFDAAVATGDKYRMFDFCYQARRLAKMHGIELPEWAQPGSQWRIRELVRDAAFEAGAAGLGYDEAMGIFREAYANGAVAGAGNYSVAANRSGIHRNTLGRYRKGSAA